jgi:N utilization substance protein A
MIEPDFEVGEEVSEEIKMVDFGRRNILALRQNLVARIMEMEKDNVYKIYKDRIGDIITGEVYQIWKREILVLDDDGNELILPKAEQIPSDYFKKGDSIRAVVSRVELKNNSPIIILSRTDTAFLERLFELEVPEVFDGLITIKRIVREPGERAKVAVESYDDRIDPVGACVGMKGSRIHGIVRELKNENIDVINWTENMQLLIQRALSPAKVVSMELIEEGDKKQANVYLRPDQVSLAIGKGGHNIKLASKLAGYEIDVYREGAEDIDDVDLDEFTDEIDDWILNELKSIGCDSAKSVLDISKEDLVKRTDLEEETVDEIMKILSSEFD